MSYSGQEGASQDPRPSSQVEPRPDTRRIFTPVVIVSYRTPGDVVKCLRSFANLRADGDLSIFICENGGSAAWADLCAALVEAGGPCAPAPEDPRFERYDRARLATFTLRSDGRRVYVLDAPENLGYAGGINAWLSALLPAPGWDAAWILNPDTEVTPDALLELERCARERDLGIVGSRVIVRPDDPHWWVGLCWRRFWARGRLVGAADFAPAAAPDPAAVEALIDAASGASAYATRACLEALAPLDERYFLFFEDIDWGLRAKQAGFGVGYAHKSVVLHAGGSSIGTPFMSAKGSSLATYLIFRNRMLFVATHYPRWWAWAAAMSCVHALRSSKSGNFGPALRGLIAGLRGETGRPEALLATHKVRAQRPEA